jgi:uncharacterized membrane protein
VSLETGKKLGFISSLIFVIVPIVAVGLLLSFIGAIVSAVTINGPTTGTLSPGFGNAFSLLGIGLVISVIILVVLSIIGLVLLLVAMSNLANYYKEPGIFKNILYAVIMNILTVVVAVVLEFALLVPASRNISVSGTATTPSSLFGGVLIGLIAIVIVAVVMSIISSVLVMRSFNLLGEKSEVDSFKTTGLLYLIGTLTAILGIGGIISWIGFIFAAIGFHRLKPLPPTSVPVTYPPQTSPTIALQTKRCPYCQTENRLDATYCRFCGKPLQ